MPFKMEANTEIEEIFCGSQVRFYNQPIGVIFAESSQLANQVSKLVKISYSQNGTLLLLPLIVEFLF